MRLVQRTSLFYMPEKQNAFTEQKAVDFIRKAYTTSFASSTLDFERFARYYKLFRNKQVEKNYTGLANLFIPEPYRIVRKKTARLANAIRKIKGTPIGPTDVKAAKISTSVLNFIREKLNWFIIERTAIQESRTIGLSWIKLTWDIDKEEEQEPYKGFDMQFATADQILLDPDATILDVFNGTYKWLINIYETDIGTLKRNKNYKKETLSLLEKYGGSKIEKSSLAQARMMTESKKEDQRREKSHKIMEFWGMYDDKKKLIVIADDKYILRFDDNPYNDILTNPAIPFVPFVGNPIGKELYPVGDIEPAESLFNELNDTRNQRMDTVTMNIDPPKEILRGAQIDEKELIARRGWVFHSNLPNGVRFIPPDMQGVRAAIDEEQAIRGDIQQVTGVLDFSPGTDVQAGVEIDTARGAIIAKNEADVLVEDDVNILKISLRMLYRIALAYARTFLDREFTVRVVEEGVEQFLNITKESIKGNTDVDIEMKTLQDRTTEQQLKLLMFNQAKTVPGAKVGKFFSDVLESFYENVNIKEYYEEPQPIEEKPKVSISLKGDLNPAEVDEIYKSMGLDPKASDPLFREEFRKAMSGNLPEFQVGLREDEKLQ